MSDLQDQSSLLATMKMRKKDSVALLREARPILTGAPQVYSVKIPHEGLNHPLLTADFLHEQYFCRSSLRPDGLVIHDLPIEQGVLRMVVIYTEMMVFPIESIILLRGQIPRAAYFSKQGWKGSPGGNDAEGFYKFLEAHAALKLGWSMEPSVLFNLGAYQRRVRRQSAWIGQIFPLGKNQFAWIYQRPYRNGFMFSGGADNFQIQKVAAYAGQVQEAVDAYGYTGLPGHGEAIYPTISMVALPEYCQRESLPLVSETRVVAEAREEG